VRCLLCHGTAVIAGGNAPDLRASPVLLSAQGFAAIVRDGALVDRGMPQFASSPTHSSIVAALRLKPRRVNRWEYTRRQQPARTSAISGIGAQITLLCEHLCTVGLGTYPHSCDTIQPVALVVDIWANTVRVQQQKYDRCGRPPYRRRLAHGSEGDTNDEAFRR